MKNIEKNTKTIEDIVASLPPQGLQSGGIKTHILDDLIKGIKNKLKKTKNLNWDFKKIVMTIKDFYNEDEYIDITTINAKGNIKSIVDNNYKILGEVYKTEEIKSPSDVYKLTIDATYKIVSGEEKTIRLNSPALIVFMHQLNDYIKFTATIEYEKSFDYSDKYLETNIQLSDYAYQIIDKFNNDNANIALIQEYIKNIIKIDLTQFNIDKLIRAIQNSDGSFQLGTDINNDEIVSEKYLYLSIISSETQGRFNLLITGNAKY